ncbi:ROK family protein [Georgenia sp. MJ173]|uniref:ROK family protein n=1 Tax=Georgenia sunbinii TaxID=3117728 RepID=UPI002F268F00
MRVGIDIGGTTTAAVLLADDGSTAASTVLPSGHGPAAVTDVAVAAVAELCAAAGCAAAAVTAVGVGIPGTVDVARGRVRNAVNLGIGTLDLAAVLAERLGAPVHVENDVNAAAVGAFHILSADGRSPGSVVYLNLGTGLACGVVLEGRLWRGTAGAAGEIGHVPVDPQGVRCTCGQRGCLETLCSGSAVARLWPTTGGPAPAALFSAAAGGDRAAQAIKGSVVGGVASAVRVAALSWDAEVIVLGGGMSELGAPLLTGVREALVAMAAASPFLRSLDLPGRVVLPEGRRNVATLGAALLADREPVRTAG